MRISRNLQIDVPKSLTEVVEDRVRLMIVNGELEFGEQITESGLSKLFNLSKTPIREALLRLSVGERLVEVKPRSGTFVFSMTNKEIDQISTIRVVLEQGAIRALSHCDRQPFYSELQKNLKESEALLKKVNLDTYRSLDQCFHEIILRYSNNPYFLEFYNIINAKVQAMRNRITFSQEYVHNSIVEHVGITQALIDMDIDGACHLVEQHINNAFTERARGLLVSSHKVVPYQEIQNMLVPH